MKTSEVDGREELGGALVRSRHVREREPTTAETAVGFRLATTQWTPPRECGDSPSSPSFSSCYGADPTVDDRKSKETRIHVPTRLGRQAKVKERTARKGDGSPIRGNYSTNRPVQNCDRSQGIPGIRKHSERCRCSSVREAPSPHRRPRSGVAGGGRLQRDRPLGSPRRFR
jgi:hypothetical protein